MARHKDKRAQDAEADPSKERDTSWTRAARITAILTAAGLFLTFVVSAAGLYVGYRTASDQATAQSNLQQKLSNTQNKLQQKINDATLAAQAPSTAVDYTAAHVDPDGQSLTVILSIESVGNGTARDCRIVDNDQVSNGGLAVGQGQSQGNLVLPSDQPIAHFDLESGQKQTFTLKFRRTLDGFVQVAISAPCRNPSSTTHGITLTVLSAEQRFQGDVTEVDTPSAES
jgi:hypothetical protein